MQDISIRYPGKEPFEKINFRINKGEHIALVGQNSYLIKALLDAIAGNAIVSKGKIDFHFIKNIKAEVSETGNVLSPYHFIGYLATVHQFRSLNGVNEGFYQQRYNAESAENSSTVEKYLSVIKSTTGNKYWTFEKVVEKLHLGKLLKEHLIKLSNGETKKVRLAAAILQNPAILLLAFPFSGIDVNTRKEISQLIDEISKSGTTIIISSSEAEIPDCITQVALIEKNNIIQYFSKDEFHKNKLPSFQKPDEELLASLLEKNQGRKFDFMVSMKDVTIRYGANIILDKINWTIRQGERWSLSGPNGSGKTTLLSLINGDNPQAFSNNIILFDRKRGTGESIWDIKKNIGFFSAELLQFFPMHTTCLAAVESGFFDTIGLYKQVSASQKCKALEWLKLMNLDQLANKSLSSVTQNERRMCLLARALVKNPAMLILDEPCQGLNEMEKLFMKDIIDAICRQTNLTLIYVSHYSEEVPKAVENYFML